METRQPDVAALAAQLVRIDSVNPGLDPAGAAEPAAATFVAGWLRAAGLEVSVLEATPGRPSVVGVAAGRGGGRSLLLTGHLDTAAVEGMEEPFSARIEDGRLYGRGSYDAKGGLAAVLLAGRTAATAGLRGDVIVAAVADEELASIGTEELLRSFTADGCVVAEPTGLTVGVRHEGLAAFELEVVGRAARATQPELGIDAVVQMGRVLVAIEDLDRRLSRARGQERGGAPSIRAASIQGAGEPGSYPGRCVLTGERRIAVGESVAGVRAELEAVLARCRARDPRLRARLELTLAREPFEASPDSALVDTVSRHAGRPALTHQPYAADSSLTAAAGIPTVLFGPGGAGAHAHVEWVSIRDLVCCAEIYSAVAADFCA
jgi:acetylornithine deacetylase